MSFIRNTLPTAMVRAANWLTGSRGGPWKDIETHTGHWQMSGRGFDSPVSPMQFSAVYSCVSIIADDISKLPLQIWQKNERGKTEVTNTAVYRVLMKPNHYQTRIDFFLYLISSYLLEGNGYAYIDRDGTGAPAALYPLPPTDVQIAVSDDGSVFYDVPENVLYGPVFTRGSNTRRIRVPARDMLHHRALTYSNPLVGITPITAAALSAHTGLRILQQSDKFFANLQRPSGILTSDNNLGDKALERLKAVWKETQGGKNFGSVAVFDGGIKWQPLTMTAVDAQLIEQLKFSVSDVARAFRVPLFLLGEGTGTTFKNAETMMSVYYSQTLSFHLGLLEERINQSLGLSRVGQSAVFDLKSILRTEFKERIEAYTRGIQQGMFTPNEARDWEGLNPKEGGDDLLVQSQMIPLNMAGESVKQGTTPATPPASEEPQDDNPDDPQDPQDDSEAEKMLRAKIRGVLLRKLAA